MCGAVPQGILAKDSDDDSPIRPILGVCETPPAVHLSTGAIAGDPAADSRLCSVCSDDAVFWHRLAHGWLIGLLHQEIHFIH